MVCTRAASTESFAKGNALTQLPSEIRFLNRLTVLSVSDNQLQSLPESIGALRELVHLLCSWNVLAALPLSLGKLHQLQSLDLKSNELSDEGAMPLLALLANAPQLRNLKLDNSNVSQRFRSKADVLLSNAIEERIEWLHNNNDEAFQLHVSFAFLSSADFSSFVHRSSTTKS
jgi:Leucine-rich repeat (LRR) protein